ncbi:50S ribosomal protein L15 [Victivallis vadensis]|jgi:ribosomal protein L15|uniref:Large ribosomal subunit protein uL15 n=1 Tax=Victivallis vadensis TaxID=172901 RepID=A0A2U1AS13_9BACT|nr:50S ribosomal protein L15 [Victivallis vadensis]NMD86482.1 50S ribosomal protein L15 [Victivallis vadensis]PVY39188.1 LSU ribosomal protein L15P [Victivallis vadensis]PWM75914.1 MAG: 50S ribosomal protein L15 [Lentisphaerota bacterium]HJH02463.1 50S ribosomal protein L15 [Victivallis vadensis]
MKLHELSPNAGSRKRRKRVGRGDSSGLGKTAGRGEKGQKSRTGSSIRPFFEGGQIPLFRRLPKRGFNSPDHIEYTLVNLNILEDNFAAGDVVDAESLRAKNLLGKTERMIKILANGEITKALTVKADKFSAAAKAKIEAVGGKVEVTE